MKRKVITCSVKNNTVTTAWVEDNTPEWVDYQTEIEMCKQRLTETDYVVIKIAEGAAVREEYEDIIDERVALRERINELERHAAEQEVAYGRGI